MKNIYFVLLLLIAIGVSLQLNAQNNKIIKGVVYGLDAKGEKAPLPGATVYWAGTGVGTHSADDGRFSIQRPNSKTNLLIAAFVSYRSDSLSVPMNAEEVEFELVESALLVSEVVIKSRARGSYISKMATGKAEVITTEGLSKMACCNLGESFENSSTVTVGYSDGVSGARQIRMLGLAGTYTQMLDENVPGLRGIATPFALSYTPGSWLESIYISKGATSVINGYEAISGQINLEYRKPQSSEPLFVNLFASDDGRMEANVAPSIRFNDKLSTDVLIHASIDPKKRDHNHDGFADLPETRQINIGNRWLYKANSNVQWRFGWRYLQDHREGGRMDFKDEYRGRTDIADAYGTDIKNKSFNAYSKLGIPIGGSNEEQSLGFIVNYAYHEQKSFFGLKNYDASEHSLFANLIYQSAWGVNKQHNYSVGASFRYDKIEEDYSDNLYNRNQTVNLDRNESVTGVFAEYTYQPNDDFNVIAGLRADYNSIYGTLITPRVLAKYTFAENSTLRASVGKGYRSPYVFTDNIGVMASSRQIQLSKAIFDDLDIEDATSFGVSFTQNFPLSGDRKAYVSVDAFRTQFRKQLILDMEQDTDNWFIYNLDGKSYANSYQIDAGFDPFERFTIAATFRYNQTKTTIRNFGRVTKPLTDNFKAVLNLTYATRLEKWKFDVTGQLNGRSRVPTTTGNMANSYNSDVYPVFYAQVTKKFKRLDVYVGCENIGDYTQSHPIINPGNPFDPSFDASLIWGPLMGRKFYAGLRLRIGEK